MTRNEFIDGGIRILGVYFLIGGILGLPSALRVIYMLLNDSTQALHAGGFRAFWSAFDLRSWTVIPSIILEFVLGWYLLKGGKWFCAQATENPL